MTGDDNDYRFAYREHVQALYHTLGEDAFYITMEQSVSEEDEQYEALLRYLDYSMVEAHEYGLLHFPETQRQGSQVAVARRDQCFEPCANQSGEDR